MGPIPLTLMFLAALAACGAFAWRKLQLLPHLQPQGRFDAPLERLKTVLFNSLLQRHMIRREPASGLLHAAIMLGFLILLLRKLQLLAVGARDLTWKNALDPFTCTECGRCKDACPTFLTGKPLSMRCCTTRSSSIGCCARAG